MICRAYILCYHTLLVVAILFSFGIISCASNITCLTVLISVFFFFFFFNDPATPEIYPLPLHDALPISGRHGALCAVTLKPEFSRLAENASKLSFGFGMYGRDTFVGYQKSIGPGNDSPAEIGRAHV